MEQSKMEQSKLHRPAFDGSAARARGKEGLFKFGILDVRECPWDRRSTLVAVERVRLRLASAAAGDDDGARLFQVSRRTGKATDQGQVSDFWLAHRDDDGKLLCVWCFDDAVFYSADCGHWLCGTCSVKRR